MMGVGDVRFGVSLLVNWCRLSLLLVVEWLCRCPRFVPVFDHVCPSRVCLWLLVCGAGVSWSACLAGVDRDGAQCLCWLQWL